MAPFGEPIARRAAAAAARTVAAGSARLFAAWADGSPVPDVSDRRCEGVADLTARQASVSAVLVPERWSDKLSELDASDLPDDHVAALRELNSPREMIYDGANAYHLVSGRWTGFFLGDPAGPRTANDPLWPLDALFGANDDAVEIGPDTVREVATTRCRLTLDLARADAAWPPGVSVPGGPFRALSRMPAELWLDASGLARRIAVNPESESGGEKKFWSIVELWDFGLAVDITPPRLEEVVPPRDAYQDAPAADS